jgi:hypothetical protein
MNRVFFPILVVSLLITSGGCGDKKTAIENTNVKTTQVLTLGTFHFSFPNLDVAQIDDEDQIDVLLPEYQKEIELIVEKLLVFQPTVIVVETEPAYQGEIDSLYNNYLMGKHTLERDEQQQIGFRIAKAMGCKKLYCVDEFGFGSHYPHIINMLSNEESEEYAAFEKAFENDVISPLNFHKESLFKTKGILAELIQSNDEENIKKDLGNYLLDVFKHENVPYDFTGVDFQTGRWFSRNLRIFRNIQRMETTFSDGILVIFGSAHLNILNYLFECSPEYTLVNTNDYLKKN